MIRDCVWPAVSAAADGLCSRWRAVAWVLVGLAALAGQAAAAGDESDAYRPVLQDGRWVILDADHKLVGQIDPYADEAVQADDVVRAEAPNRICWQRTFALKPAQTAKSVRLTMDFRAAHTMQFALIPGISWNGNPHDPGNVYHGFAEDGVPWSFASHRTLIPGATYSEGSLHAIGMWAEISHPEIGFACSLIPAEDHTLHRLIVPEEEMPRRVLIRERGLSSGSQRPLVLQPGQAVTVTARIVLAPVRRPRLGYHSLLDAAWSQAYRPTQARHSTDQLWSLGIQFIKESLWDEQAGMFHLAMAYDEKQQKWIRAGGFSIGWCGRNGELANALIENYLRSGERASLEMALKCLDTWAQRVGEPAVERPKEMTSSDTSGISTGPYLGSWTVTYNNGAVAELTFQANGQIAPHPSWGRGELQELESGGIRCQWSNGQREEYRLEGDRLIVEHWFDGQRYEGLGRKSGPLARYRGLAADANTLSDGASSFLRASELIKQCNLERPAYRRIGLGICDAALAVQQPDGRFDDAGCQRGAIGAAFIPPLLTAWELTRDDKYLRGARSALGYYMDMLYRDGYLWGGALDTRSIDKETVLPLLVGAVRLYEFTGEAECLSRSIDAAYYLAAWQLAQCIPNVPGSLMDSIDYDTWGGTSVATVHMCADPFGVSAVPYLLRLARHTKQEIWAQRAQSLWNNASQGISNGTLALHGLPPRPSGSQDETVNYTDWGYDYLAQGMDRSRPRGAGQGWLTAWPTAMRLTILADPEARQHIDSWPVQTDRDAPKGTRLETRAATQYILLNRAPGQGMYQGRPESLGREGFDDILAVLPNRPEARIQTGLSYVLSCFRTPPETTVAALRTFLEAAEATSTPILVQIDTEHWWEARPDLWNWWDPQQPGFDPANRDNVEWTGWSSDSALKLAWRNWGRQIRVLPPPNLASPRYLAACHAEIRRLIPIIMDWHARLPDEKKHLLVGIKLGHETSIGVNAYHFPQGNALLAQPPSSDPTVALNTEDVLARGVAQIGFAALKTSGIRAEGNPTESELRDVAQRYLQSLCQVAAEAGVPRHLLFAHGAGWKRDELVYDVPVNPFACPGWSFYSHAADPHRDTGVQRNLARSDAPYWAATEWLLQGTYETSAWRTAFDNTLADPRCRYLCIFNWESICQQPTVLQAISETVAASVPAAPRGARSSTSPAAPDSPPTIAHTGRVLVGATMCPIWRGEDRWKPLLNFAERQPLLGWYEEGTPEVTDWEIKWALEHGISFFLVCWYRAPGNENKPVVPALSHWLHEGLPLSRWGDQFRFAITFENNHRAFSGTVSEADLFDHLLPYWMENYFRRPNYLVIDGRPVLAIYNVQKFIADLGGEATAAAAVARMQAACRNAGWSGLYLLGQCCWGSPTDLQRQAEQILRVGMDASWAYHLPTFTGAFGDKRRPTGDEAIAAQEKIWDSLRQPSLLTLSVGWDSQPWRSSQSPVQWRLTGSEFRRLCELAKSRLERRAPESLAGRLVLLDGWNEYGEGHFICPTVGHRFDYLDAVRDVFAADAAPHSDLAPDVQVGRDKHGPETASPEPADPAVPGRQEG